MKRLVLVLSIIMLFTLCVSSCSKDIPDEGSIDDISLKEEPKEVKSDVTVDEEPLNTIVSYGASYTVSFSADELYQDTYNTELTDGFTASEESGFASDAFSGYTSSSLSVVIDLGYICEKIYSFNIGYFVDSGAGIQAPSSIKIYASFDGADWVSIDELKELDNTDVSRINATVKLEKYINARYIKFNMRNASAWMFYDEIEVIADMEKLPNNTDFINSINTAYDKNGVISPPLGVNDIDRSLSKVLVSKGASYTIDGTVSTNYSDDGIKLTDGISYGSHKNNTWVGFEDSGESKVTIDLGSAVEDVALVEMSFFTNIAAKIYLPAAVKLTVFDNESKTDITMLYPDKTVEYGPYVFSLPLSKSIKANKIEVTLFGTEGGICLAEEFAVYAYREDNPMKLYPSINIDTDINECGSDANDEYCNLISGKTQQIISVLDPGKEHYESNTSVDSTLMTDGVFADNTDIHNGKFFKFLYGNGRKVVYDLEKISLVDKFTASFTHQSDWAVTAPSRVTVYLSEDGTDWYNIGEIKLSGESDPSIYKGELKLDSKVKVRYVVFTFDVIGWAGCDELEVYGIKNSVGGKSLSEGDYKKEALFVFERQKPSADILGNTSDLCLLYHSVNNGYTAEDLIPYLAYVDTDGNIKDTMFDSFLFLHVNNVFPSGKLPYMDSIMSDWEWTLDDLFLQGDNVSALDEAAGQVKEALGLGSDYKYKVSLTLYYPDVTCTAFGDVDGDGVTEDFSNYDDRIKAIKWYIEFAERLFAEKQYKNIELVGYYWWHEEVKSDDPDSEALMNDISDIVHSYDRDFFWIPYFNSKGFDEWSKYGFDVACRQPNYVFNITAPYSNIVDCAELTKLYGMGIEMELFEDVLTDKAFFKKYMQYLSAGAELGYMKDSIVMYYQSLYVLRDAANSDSVMARTVYDRTYQFIKGTLHCAPKAITQSCDANCNEVFEGDLGFSDDTLREYALYTLPEHGSVTINSDGTFTYYPEKDYTGEVKFEFVYSEYLGWSDPCEIVINIK